MTALTLPQKISLSFAAQAFSEIFPIQSLIHVGYGSGRGDFCFWKLLSPKSVYLIDAHSIVNVPKSDDFSVKCVQATLSAGGGIRDWTHSQLASENSLLSEKAILSRWPHVKGLGVKPVDTLTLDNLIINEDINSSNWLLIDCHPAHEVLLGASTLLAGIEVVVLRGVSSETEVFPAQSCLESLCIQLNAFGLKLAHSLKQDNDLFIDALFVRFDYKKRLTLSIESSRHSLQLACEKFDQSFKECNALAQSLEVLQVERDQLRGTSDETAQELGAVKAQVAELEQQRTILNKSLEVLQVERDQLRGTSDETAQELLALKDLVTKLDKEKGELTAARDAEAKAKTEANGRLAALEKDKAALTTAREVESKAKADFEQRNVFLEADNADLQARQQLFHEELVKAEAQIDLIKDLLLC
jgi:hypothetical protein